MGTYSTARRRRIRMPRSVAILLIGILVGLSTSWLSQAMRFVNFRCMDQADSKADTQLILIGIMTAAKYVDTRAYTVWRTWAQEIPGRVLFFVAENTQSIHPDMPLVRLKGVDDTYPPQKKSFAMLRWMADRHLHDYHWFMRADDDLYVRGDRLERLLRSLDPQKAQLLGQAGLGNTAEYGHLSLGQQDNYCMGGPGVVLSRETLRAVRPHLGQCISQMLTTHEDVEIGRCIRVHVGVPCTWNYEMHALFHNNQSTTTAYTGTLEELRHAVTLHPIKRPAVMRRVHVAAQSYRLNELRSERVRIGRDLPDARLPSLIRHIPQTPADLKPWNYISSSNILFCVDEVNCPRHTVPLNTRTAVADVIKQLFEQFNSNARIRGRVLQFQSIQYGYMRVEPSYGVDYVLDMILWFKKFRGPNRATVSVRRHAYVQQTFGAAQCTGEQHWRWIMQKHAAARELSLDDEEFPNQSRILPVREPVIGAPPPAQQVSSPTNAVIHIILPLSGRVDTFRRFATHLRNICTNRDKLALIVVLFSSAPADDANLRTMIAELSEHVRVQVVDMGNAEFSRGVALTRGAATLAPDALMFFTDVDMLFTCDALDRIRLNTVHGAQVYFPIVFSEYSPETWSDNDRLMVDAFHYGRRRGYFRHFGFGLVSLYKSDLDSVGGLATNIHGWGLEDVDLFDKCVKSRLGVIRAPDPGLVHIYHSIHCPPGMPTAQFQMCIGSKAASLASLDSLADQISLYP